VLRDLLGRYAASAPAPNASLTALAAAWPRDREPVRAHVPFASRRRWSGLELDGRAMLLGAPELLAPEALAERAAAEARQGRRLLAAAEAPAGLGDRDPDLGPPGIS
jgi:hypothetical protein